MYEAEVIHQGEARNSQQNENKDSQGKFPAGMPQLAVMPGDRLAAVGRIAEFAEQEGNEADEWQCDNPNQPTEIMQG